MTTDVHSLRNRLERFGQQHLLDFWDQLASEDQRSLAQQLLRIDFANIQSALQESESAADWKAIADASKPPPAIRLDGILPEEAEAARESGEQALRAGRIGVVLVAGGQGSRLGFDLPKGMYPVGPVSNRTLFEIHVDRLLAVGNRYGVRIPLYVMTSPATHQATIDYFEQNDRLGLAEDQLIVFCQGTIPAVDADSGRLLLETPSRVFESPDGHGGTVAALHRDGCLKRMQRDGVEQLYYLQVDNPLVKIADPKFVGQHLLAGSEMTTQVIAKQDPMEKVGNVVSVDGQLQIIEYSDLPESAAGQRNPDGSLRIWAGNIAVHMIDCQFLRRMVNEQGGLPWHLARKIVPFVNAKGEAIQPNTPNAIKLETFIFDLLPFARNALVVEVSERDEFAPLKNASGAAKDTPETCRAAISDRCRRWLQAAGADVDEGVTVEIASRYAIDAGELTNRIEAGIKIQSDKYFA